MDFIIILVVIGVAVFIYAKRSSIRNVFSSKTTKLEPPKIYNSDLVKVLLNLDEKSLDELFKLYKNEFGVGAAYYARRTYGKWKTGAVRPNNQTYNRFLLQLPKAMSYDLKCEVLRELMEEYGAKDEYDLTVSVGDWEEKLTPLVQTLVDKPFTTALPQVVEKRLKWLADGEMQTAQDILRASQIEEGKIAVSMLREEIAHIERLLENAKGDARVRHRLKFPCGAINLEIKKN